MRCCSECLIKEIYKSTNTENIETYLQSGNIIFNSNISDNKKISKIIEQKIKNQFGFNVLVLTKTKREFEKIINNNPYMKNDELDIAKFHVTFLWTKIMKSYYKHLSLEAKDTSDKYHMSGSEIYLYCPNGYGRTKLTNNYFEKVLSTNATTRNWKTTKKLLEIASEY